MEEMKSSRAQDVCFQQSLVIYCGSSSLCSEYRSLIKRSFLLLKSFMPRGEKNDVAILPGACTSLLVLIDSFDLLRKKEREEGHASTIILEALQNSCRNVLIEFIGLSNFMELSILFQVCIGTSLLAPLLSPSVSLLSPPIK